MAKKEDSVEDMLNKGMSISRIAQELQRRDPDIKERAEKAAREAEQHSGEAKELFASVWKILGH